MREDRTKTIANILEEMDVSDEERKSIEKEIERSLQLIGCEEIGWKEFQIYEQSVPRFSQILKKHCTEYLLAVTDFVQSFNTVEAVKITIQHGKSKEVKVVRVNGKTAIAIIFIPRTEEKKLKNE